MPAMQRAATCQSCSGSKIQKLKISVDGLIVLEVLTVGMLFSNKTYGHFRLGVVQYCDSIKYRFCQQFQVLLYF